MSQRLAIGGLEQSFVAACRTNFAGLTSPDCHAGHSGTAALFTPYFTFAGTIRVAPDYCSSPTGPTSAIVYCNATAVGGEGRKWLEGNRLLPFDCASRNPTKAGPGRRRLAACADQEPNLLKEKHLPNKEKLTSDTTLSVLL
jgi:hypothetical protein